MAALLWGPRNGFAQQPAGNIPRIGFLGVSTATAWTTRVDAFRAGLRDMGYVEGKNIAIEFRFAEGQYDRLPGLAAELVRLKVDVIVTHSGPGALAAKQATDDPIPVVMTNVSDALGAGVVASLRAPAATSPATRSSFPSSRQNVSSCSRMPSRACAVWRSSQIRTMPRRVMPTKPWKMRPRT
jgi:hypothetical protein